jgi:hypothetical protein
MLSGYRGLREKRSDIAIPLRYNMASSLQYASLYVNFQTSLIETGNLGQALGSSQFLGCDLTMFNNMVYDRLCTFCSYV